MRQLYINGEKIAPIPEHLFQEGEEKIFKTNWPAIDNNIDLSKFDFIHLSVENASIKFDNILNTVNININKKEPRFRKFIVELSDAGWVLDGYFISTSKPELLMIYSKGATK